MADIVGAAKGVVPDFDFGQLFGAVTILIFIIVLSFLAIFLGYLWIQRKKFNKKLIIFEKINGRWEPTRRDKAMEKKLGSGGDTIFYLKKHRKHIPVPALQMGRRTYWMCIREDGEWINFELGDIDLQMRQAGVKYLHDDMRHSRTALQQGLKERFDKKSLWKEYGILIVSIGFIVIVGVMTWFLFDKWIELAAVTNQGVETSGEVMELGQSVMISIDNLISSIPACPPT